LIYFLGAICYEKCRCIYVYWVTFTFYILGTLRNILNDAWNIDGLNFQGNREQNYLFNSQNATPNNTLRNLTENNNNINNFQGNHEQNYLFNKMNAIPNTTLRNLTENNNNINNAMGNHAYRPNTTTLRETLPA
jgi:hypothetical protein